MILQQAWTHLYDEEIPFEICFGHGCLYLRLLLQSEKLIGEMGDFPIFGLFDFDMAYNEWNSIKGEADLEETDPYNGITKKVLGKNSYAILVPWLAENVKTSLSAWKRRLYRLFCLCPCLEHCHSAQLYT